MYNALTAYLLFTSCTAGSDPRLALTALSGFRLRLQLFPDGDQLFAPRAVASGPQREASAEHFNELLDERAFWDGVDPVIWMNERSSLGSGVYDQNGHSLKRWPRMKDVRVCDRYSTKRNLTVGLTQRFHMDISPVIARAMIL